MLATLTGEPFNGKGWIFELKLDGYRVIAAKDEGKANLYSRRGNTFTENYALIAEQVSRIGAQFVLDGEICYTGKSGRPDFQKLQSAGANDNNLHYYVFDLLWLNGYDLLPLPLKERRKLLDELLKNPPGHIHLVEQVETRGKDFFAEVSERHLEGMIAKRSDSAYRPGDGRANG